MSEKSSLQSVQEEARRALGYTRDVVGNGPNDFRGPQNNLGGVSVEDAKDGLPEGKVFNRKTELEAYDDGSLVASVRTGTGRYEADYDDDAERVSRTKKGYEHVFTTHADRAKELIAQLAVKDIVEKNDEIVENRINNLQKAREAFHNPSDR